MNPLTWALINLTVTVAVTVVGVVWWLARRDRLENDYPITHNRKAPQ